MMLRLIRSFSIEVPKNKLKITFSKSSGPGGQHVNKTNSKADVRFSVDCAEWISPEARSRLKTMFPHYINKEGEFVVQSQKYRDQTSNEADAIEKIAKMVNRACEPVKERNIEEYKESEESKKRRIQSKRESSERKSLKREKFDNSGRHDSFN